MNDAVRRAIGALRACPANLDAPGGFDALHAALRLVITEAYAIDAATATSTEVEAKLVHQGASEAVQNAWSRCARELDVLRFAPPGAAETSSLTVACEELAAGVESDPMSGRLSKPPTPTPTTQSVGSKPALPPAVPKEELEIFRKSPDTTYSLVFTVPQRERGVFDQSTTVPVLEFGTHCICCDKKTTGRRRLRGDGHGDYYAHDIYQAPVCGNCEGHAVVGEVGQHIRLTAVAMCVLMLILGVVMWWPVQIAVCVGILALFLFFARLGKAKRRRLAARGHAAGFQLHIGHDEVVVMTDNPRVAGELVHRYAHLLSLPSAATPSSF